MNLCRICLTVTEDFLIPMLKILNGNEMQILENGCMYENCLGIQLGEYSNFNSLCVTCHMQLKYFDEFKNKALESYKKLPLMVVHEIKDESDNDCQNDNESAIQINSENTDLFHVDVEYLDESDDGEPEESEIENVTIPYDEVSNYKSDSSSNKEMEIIFETSFNTKNIGANKRIASKKKFKHHCITCNKNFNTDGTYEAHMNTHKGLPPYQCTECGKSFNGKVNYEYHMKHHKNERDYKCEICGKAYLGKWDLKLHMKVHSDDRPFICDICSKAFRLRNHLISHIETHNEGHNYTCEHCHQKYKTKTTLRSHITTMHTNVKSFVCTLCSRVFGRRHHLQAHMESHERKMKKEKNMVF